MRNELQGETYCKNTKMRRLNNMLLNKQWFTEEVLKVIKEYLETKTKTQLSKIYGSGEESKWWNRRMLNSSLITSISIIHIQMEQFS